MSWQTKLPQGLTSVVLLLTMFNMASSQFLSITISPAIVTTSKTFTVSADSKHENVTGYKFSFGSWVLETTKKTVNHRYYFAGKYTLMVTARFKEKWTPWTKKTIQVFDHDAVIDSKCQINILPSIPTRTEASLVGNTVTYMINITLVDCYGVCQIYINSSSGSFNLIEGFISYGQSEHIVTVNASYCRHNEVYFEIVTLKEVVTKEVNLASLCQNQTNINGTSNTSSHLTTSQVPFYNITEIPGGQNVTSPPIPIPVTVYGTLNVVVAVFFTIILGFYLTMTFLSYLENKRSQKSVMNLTDINDEVMYEIQFHVGSAFSVQSTECKLKFTMYGTEDVLGPIFLPVSPFEQDGIASFLISTKRPLGEIGSIGIFCLDMNLRSDWYLRKVEILSHSQKPNGNHWGDDDRIESMAVFECHTWFQPAVKTDSVAQIFHNNTIENETTFAIDYFNRCHQLFFQKHILTSWRCSFGVNNFSKTQRLSFLYTLWFVIICMSSFYLVDNGINKAEQAEHKYHIGILRLDEQAIYFAFTRGISAYVIGVLFFFAAKVVYGQTSSNHSMRPGHVDSRGHKIYDLKQNRNDDIISNNEYTVLHDDCRPESSPTFADKHKNGFLQEKDLKSCSDGNCPTETGFGRRISPDLNHVVINFDGPIIAEQVDKNLEMVEGNDRGQIESKKVAFNTRNATIPVGGTSNTTQMLDEFKIESDDVENDARLKLEDSFKYSTVTSAARCESSSAEAFLDCPVDEPQRLEQTLREESMQVPVTNAGHDAMRSDNKQKHDNNTVQVSLQEGNERLLRDANVDESEQEKIVNGFVEIQFLNRETLPPTKKDQWKKLLLKFSSRIFWIAFTILLLFCLFHALVISTEWSRDVAYHWLSYHILALVFSCFVIDTARVMIYILLITLRERKRLHLKMKRLSFDDYITLLLESKHAEKERERFCRLEYAEDKMRFAQDHHRLQGKFRDLFIVGIFVISLLMLTTWTVDKNSFTLGRTLARQLFNLDDLLSIQQSNTQLDPIVNLWLWLEKTVYPVIDVTKRDVSLQGLILIERGLRVVQKRVIPGKCDIAAQMKNIVQECSLGFDKDTEDFRRYAPGWKAFQSEHVYNPIVYAWEHTENGDHSSNGSLQSSSLRGYAASFDTKRTKNTLVELKKFNWIDRYTRYLYLDNFVYDASLNLMSQAFIEVEFKRSGYIRIHSSFFNFLLFPELSQNHEWIQLAESVFVVLTIYFTFDIVKRKRRTSLSWLSMWLIIQTIVTILSFTTLSLYFYKNYNVFLLTLDSLSSFEKNNILRKVVSIQRTLEFILSVLNLVALVFLTKPLFTLGLFDDMYTAICRTMRDAKGIAMETIVLLIGLGFWANLAFAADISSFSTTSTTFPTLMDMLVRPDNSELYEISFFGPLFIFVYYIIMVLFVTNVFISSVQGSYSEAREVFDQIARETVFKLLLKKLKKKRLTEHHDLSFTSRTRSRKKGRKSQAKNREQSVIEPQEVTDNTSLKNMTQDDNEESKNAEAENEQLASSLEKSIARLEKVVDKKVLYEHVEDKILISAITDKWNKVVLKRPPLSVISLYKPMIRK